MTKNMRLYRISLLVAAFLASLHVVAQDVEPTASYTDKDNNIVESKDEIKDVDAPLVVSFKANPTDMDDWTPHFEWHFMHQNGTSGWVELLVRYDEDTEYTFSESGTYRIELRTTLVNGTDTADIPAKSITISISESKLEFPNAFSPNGDGTNDVYQAKDGYRSIVEFHAYIFNRWGQKLYEWTDVSKGWDGKYNGRDVSDGVYFVLVKARGADGREYVIRRDVNLLRGFTTKSGTSTTP